jgi:hypothetical protein
MAFALLRPNKYLDMPQLPQCWVENDKAQAVLTPITLRIEKFHTRKTSRTHGSPLTGRKFETRVNLPSAPGFKTFNFHICADSKKALILKARIAIRKFMHENNTDQVFVKYGSFITPFDCVELNWKLEDGPDITGQLRTMASYYFDHLDEAEKKLPLAL